MKNYVILAIVLLGLSLAPAALAQTPVAATITVEGRLVNATPGGAVAAGVPLMLHSYDGQQMVGVIEGTSEGNGTFRFEGIEVPKGRRFEVMATVGRTAYLSDNTAPAPGQTKLVLPVTIYETTTDPSALHIAQMHTIVEFLSPTQLQVFEVYVIANDGDRAVEGAVTLDDGRAASLRFGLPAGATGLSFGQAEASDRFIRTADGFADSWGVPPGPEAAQVAVSYLVPYRDGLRLERSLSYPTDGVSVVLPQGDVRLVSEALAPQGSLQMQDGRQVDIFTAADFQAGQTLAFELRGQPTADVPGALAASPARPAPGLTLVPVGLIALGLALIGGAIWWWRRPLAPSPVAAATTGLEGPETILIRAIAQLDEAYQAGILPEDNYLRQRNSLRAELKTLLARSRRAGLTGFEAQGGGTDQPLG